MSSSPLKLLSSIERKEALLTSRKRTKIENKSDTSSQRRAQALLERENRNARQSRKATLIGRHMIGKFGTRRENTAINRKIMSEVESYINENPSFTESDMGALEEHIQEVKSSMRRNSPRNSSTPTNQDQSSNNGSNPPSRSSSVSDPPLASFDANWSVINAYKMVRDEDRMAKEMAVHKEKQNSYRVNLEAQLEAIQKREEDEKLVTQMERERICREVKEEEEANLKKKLTARAKFSNELREREKQIIMIKKRREDAIEQERSEEKKEMERSRRAVEEMRKEVLEKKAARKVQLEKFRIENEAMEEVKRGVRAREVEIDLRQQREYEEKLERDERRREEAFNARLINNCCVMTSNFN